MTKRLILPSLLTVLPILPLQAADVQIVAQNPVVELTVNEEVESTPDRVQVTAGVVTDAQTAVEALRQNAVDMRRVIDRIKAAGIAERDIQTANLSVSPRWDYDQGQQRQIFRGYRAANQVSIRFADVKRVGPVLDALVSAGANDINGPLFSVVDDERYKAEARRRAMARAQRQAEEYARGAGYTGVRLLQVTERLVNREASSQGAIVVTGSRISREAVAPVEPGSVATGVVISVSYEMTR